MPEHMEDMSIAFPHLGIYLDYVPKSFTVFGFTIAMYGLIIGLGVLLAVTLITRIASRTGQDPDDYWDLATYLVLISVAGARLYYVIFSWDMYKDDPIQILNIRNGGLAIYGGVLAGILTLFVYTRIKKKNFLTMADTIVYGVILGQMIGRWGNFTNREVFGDYTDNLVAMRIPMNMVRKSEITTLMKTHIPEGANYIQVHPTFLYESMWNLMILVLMLLYHKHKKFEGEIMLLYFGGYGLGRAMIESIRTDQLKIPGTVLPISQVIAIGMLMISVAADLIIRFKIKHRFANG